MNIYRKTKAYLSEHRKVSFLIICVLVLISAWVKSTYFNNPTLIYDLSKVERGAVVSSISATGQVSASNQVDVASKTSGEIVYLKAVSGQEVKTGDLIAQIDLGTAWYDLQNAQLAYDQAVADNLNNTQKSSSTLSQAQESYENSYVDAISIITSSSNEMISNLDSLDNLFNNSGYLNPQNNSSFSKIAKTLIKKAEDEKVTARRNLKTFTKQIQSLSTQTSKDKIETSLKDSYNLALQILQVSKDTQDAVIYARDRESPKSTQSDSAYSSIVSISSNANTTVVSINSAKNSINSNKVSLLDAQNTIDGIKSGTNQLDVQSKLIALKQKQLAYSDYFIRAPFDGVVASVAVQKGDTINSGASIATVITKKKLAEISLNEIDASKVKVGQPVSLTFDALDGVTVDGQVIETDLVGTVSSGVVSYKIKIEIDSDNDQIKSGMTTTANITIDSAQDVLRIRSSAIKSQGNVNFVQLADIDSNTKILKGVTLLTRPQQVEVVSGIVGDQYTEVVDGLNEGDVYVTRTIDSTSKTTSAPSLLGNIGGARGATGGSARTGAPTGFPRD